MRTGVEISFSQRNDFKIMILTKIIQSERARNYFYEGDGCQTRLNCYMRVQKTLQCSLVHFDLIIEDISFVELSLRSADNSHT